MESMKLMYPTWMMLHSIMENQYSQMEKDFVPGILHQDYLGTLENAKTLPMMNLEMIKLEVQVVLITWIVTMI